MTDDPDSHPFSAREGWGMLLAAIPWPLLIRTLLPILAGGGLLVKGEADKREAIREVMATRSIVYQNEAEATERIDARDPLLDDILARLRRLEGERFGPSIPEGHDGDEHDGER